MSSAPLSQTDSPRGLVYAIAAYGLWGFLPIYMKALAHVPPLEVIAHRVIWSLPIAGAVLLWQGRQGEVLAALDAAGVAERTLVLFTSDNGGMFNRGGQTAWETGHRLNGELLGMKFGAWEGGHRVPLLARWPGRIAAGAQSGALVSNLDFLATFAELVGRSLGSGEGPDSISLLPLLLGHDSVPVRETLLISPARKSHLAVRHGRWMYIPAQDEGGFSGTRPGEHDFAGAAVLPFTGQSNSDVVDGRIRPDAPPAQLYDLQADPRQAQNLFAERPEVVREMQALLDRLTR